MANCAVSALIQRIVEDLRRAQAEVRVLDSFLNSPDAQVADRDRRDLNLVEEKCKIVLNDIVEVDRRFRSANGD